MIMNILIIIATVLISFAIGVPVGMAYRKKIAESKIQGAENEAKRVLEIAKKEAENEKHILSQRSKEFLFFYFLKRLGLGQEGRKNWNI